MPLTPAHIRGVAFNKPPRGKRGYHEDEVDAFLDVVAAELARLLEQHTDLRTQLAQCDQQPSPAAIDTAAAPLQSASPPMRQPPSADADNSHHHAARVLNLAQHTADRITSQATAEADALLSQAHTHAKQLLCQARTTAEALISEATIRVERHCCIKAKGVLACPAASASALQAPRRTITNQTTEGLLPASAPAPGPAPVCRSLNATVHL